MPDENFTKFAFTDTVKGLQERYGSRGSYRRMEESGDRFVLTGKERAFVTTRDGFYLATVGSGGWPYVQFRGGPVGFLKCLDEQTLGFADYRGNRQFISSGNMVDNGRVAMILVDYPTQQRLKIWAEARLVFAEDDPRMMEQLVDPSYPARAERAIVLSVRAYDWNCPQHITPRYRADEIGKEELRQLDPELLASCCPEETDGGTPEP